ncbi:MAG: Holliday junction branch migration protein RuvA [Minisyncoccia bacterium]
MISSLEGKILEIGDRYIVLNVNGIGFKIFLSKNSFNKLPQIGENLKLFCFLDFSERGFSLYGFLTKDEMEVFEVLNSISGIGPKASLEISSVGSMEKLLEETKKGNTKIFENIPGVGKKKIQKIIFELSGKIQNLKKEKSEGDEEIILSLSKLGFSKNQIKEAILKLPQDIKDEETKIREILKILGR